MVEPRNCDIAFVIGTSAELIKLWPLVTDISSRAVTHLLSTNQQPVELGELCDRLAIRNVVHLRKPSAGNLVSRAAVPSWAAVTGLKLYWQLAKMRRSAQRSDRDVLVIVHGDTMTCLLAAAVSRMSRCRVAHVEAGLRSHDWRNPFPEELNRILTARLAELHFCPDQVAIENLKDRHGLKVNTRGNTSRDSMLRIQDQIAPVEETEPYVLVSLHRAELLASRDVLSESVRQLVRVATTKKVVMVVDALTREALAGADLLDTLTSSRVEIKDKMPYPDFLQLVVSAERVVTDSGGLQEECGFLSIPCLIHRRATERLDGLESTAHLSMWRPNAIVDFCDEPLATAPGRRSLEDVNSPTAVIIETLTARGYLPS